VRAGGGQAYWRAACDGLVLGRFDANGLCERDGRALALVCAGAVDGRALALVRVGCAGGL
jgi:hypothetical protein